MTATPDFLDHLEADGARFAAALESVDPGAPVPCCPDWSAHDLLVHLTRVHWFWREIVERRAAHPDEIPDEFRPADTFESLVGQYREGLDALVAVLGSSETETPVWTWDESGTTAAWVRRRQAHEALIHRIDAEQTAGSVGPVDRLLAADGVDEVLRVVIAGVPSWGEFTPDGDTVALVQSDGDGRWELTFGRFTGTSGSGRRYDMEACMIDSGILEPRAVVEGTAEALDLWLWGRGSREALVVSGEAALADRLRQLAKETTQ